MRVHSDITEEKLAQTRLSFLAEASTCLAATLDYDRALADVARLAVPTLADWCLVDLVEADGRLRRVATAHADPALRERARAWEAQFPPDEAAPNGAAEVVRTGRPEMVSEIPDALLAANARNAEQLRLLREWSPKSYLCVPLIARGRILGAITLVTAESGRRYGNADLELAEELAGRAALAVDNARLYDETRARAERESLINKIGQTLRGSLDPDRVLADATGGRRAGPWRQPLHLGASHPRRGNPSRSPRSSTSRPALPPYAATVPVSAYPPELREQWEAGHSVALDDVGGRPARGVPRTA